MENCKIWGEKKIPFLQLYSRFDSDFYSQFHSFTDDELQPTHITFQEFMYLFP